MNIRIGQRHRNDEWDWKSSTRTKCISKYVQQQKSYLSLFTAQTPSTGTSRSRVRNGSAATQTNDNTFVHYIVLSLECKYPKIRMCLAVAGGFHFRCAHSMVCDNQDNKGEKVKLGRPQTRHQTKELPKHDPIKITFSTYLHAPTA